MGRGCLPAHLDPMAFCTLYLAHALTTALTWPGADNRHYLFEREQTNAVLPLSFSRAWEKWQTGLCRLYQIKTQEGAMELVIRHEGGGKMLVSLCWRSRAATDRYLSPLSSSRLKSPLLSSSPSFDAPR